MFIFLPGSKLDGNFLKYDLGSLVLFKVLDFDKLLNIVPSKLDVGVDLVSQTISSTVNYKSIFWDIFKKVQDSSFFKYLLKIVQLVSQSIAWDCNETSESTGCP